MKKGRQRKNKPTRSNTRPDDTFDIEFALSETEQAALLRDADQTFFEWEKLVATTTDVD